MSQTSISQVLRAVTLEDVPRALGRPRALPSVQRLVATEAAAEGINLQFCSLVVNYDLPWNTDDDWDS